ncbi:MAG: tripartite tricarboxylate transporter TctB family protein [Sphaerochaetaceae bacterium]|nr:tripartite tricarboxylate transporter TctB family protein [Spirochaetales bacterium]MDY5498495.1 tripartite tricarboxylate transporter TctB family protein [Sphaerochaetaceae bacterium]
MTASRWWSKTFVGGTVSLIVSLILLAQNTEPSSMYPWFVLGGMSLFSALTIVSSIRSSTNEPVQRCGLKELLLMAVLFLNPIGMQIVGFWVTAFLEIFIFSLLVETDFTKKKVFSLVLFCLLCVVVSYCIFAIGLRIRCPRGMLL